MKFNYIRGLVTAAVVLSIGSTTMAQGVAPAPKDAQQIEMLKFAAMKTAGMRSDRSQIPTLIAALKEQKYSKAALHSLAQIGGPGALAGVEKWIRETGGANDYTRVVRARMVAQNSANSSPNDAASAQSKLSRFLNELGMDVTQINVGRKKNRERGRRSTDDSIEIYALDELADMIYYHHDSALATAAKAAGIDFEQDIPASLKVRLAPLSSQERARELVEFLSQQQAITFEIRKVIQIAANEGVVASRLAAAKLQQMKGERDKYQYTVFAAMFDVIAAVGDKEQAPVVATFLKDSDSWVAYYADQTYPDISSGIPVIYVLGH